MRSGSPNRFYSRSRSPIRSGSPVRSVSPHRDYGHRHGYGYIGPNYGNWGLGAASGLVLGTALGAAINPYVYQRPRYVPYYSRVYGIPYRIVEYDIYGTPILIEYI